MARRARLPTPKQRADELVRDARRALQRARATYRARVQKLRAKLKRYRRLAMAAVRRWYREELARLRAERDRRLALVRERVAREHAELRAPVDRAARRLAEQRAIGEALVEVHGGRRGRGRDVRSTARERVAEDHDRARHHLEVNAPELVPVFEQVKKQLRPTAKLSMLEAFLKWAEQNPEETLRIQAEHGDRMAERDIREHERALAEEQAARDAQAAERRRELGERFTAERARARERRARRHARADAITGKEVVDQALRDGLADGWHVQGVDAKLGRAALRSAAPSALAGRVIEADRAAFVGLSGHPSRSRTYVWDAAYQLLRAELGRELTHAQRTARTRQRARRKRDQEAERLNRAAGVPF